MAASRSLSLFIVSALATSALACSAAPPGDETSTGDDALRRRGVEVDPPVRGGPPEPTVCEEPNPLCTVTPIADWDAAEVADMRVHGCDAPIMYRTGKSAGILGASMSVCVDNARARAFVASKGGSWAPPGACDKCLAPLPRAKRYVVWSWAIGPNCGSGCSPGVRPW